MVIPLSHKKGRGEKMSYFDDDYYEGESSIINADDCYCSPTVPICTICAKKY